MIKIWTAVRACLLSVSLVAGFTSGFLATSGGIRVPLSSREQPRGALYSSDTPTVEQLSSDGFMSQVSHAANLVQGLSDSDSTDEELTKRLAAQFSHSDGIRGFFVQYLTGDGETAADSHSVPPVLAEAMAKANQDELIPLVCMNVVMPTATSTMHTDPTLSAASSKTAERGLTVLKSLLDSKVMKDNCKAIYAATTKSDADADEELVEYWTKFFTSYGYEERQLTDIANVFAGLAS